MAISNPSAYPRIRLGITLLLTVVIGVLSSVLASQIMPQGVLDWTLLYKSSSFVVLVVVVIVWLLVQLVYLKSDIGLYVYADDLHCEAVIRKLMLKALADDLRINPSKGHTLNVSDLRKQLGIKTILKQKDGAP